MELEATLAVWFLPSLVDRNRGCSALLTRQSVKPQRPGVGLIVSEPVVNLAANTPTSFAITLAAQTLYHVNRVAVFRLVVGRLAVSRSSPTGCFVLGDITQDDTRFPIITEGPLKVHTRHRRFTPQGECQPFTAIGSNSYHMGLEVRFVGADQGTHNASLLVELEPRGHLRLVCCRSHMLVRLCK